MSAAVADYRPKHPASRKLKKQDKTTGTLELERTTDILSMLSSQKTSQFMVGFAAETDDLLAHAKEKLASKNLDLVVANDVTTISDRPDSLVSYANDVTRPAAGFGSDENAALLIDRHGQVIELPLKSKRELAHDILDAARRLLRTAPSRQTGRRADAFPGEGG